MKYENCYTALICNLIAIHSIAIKLINSSSMNLSMILVLPEPLR